MDQGDQLEQFVRNRAGTRFAVTGGPVWLSLIPDGLVLPEDGWKLHVSSRASTYPALVEAVLPVLLAEGCAFKLARSHAAVTELNDGVTSPANVGKALTIYPDQARVRELGLRLAGLLEGHEGPRVLSDRRVSGSAPVYYRFGPFAPKRAPDARGRLVTTVHGPDGAEAEGAARLRYAQPAWVRDPFAGDGAPETGADLGQAVLGGRYRIIAGIREAAQGNVYRAQDLTSGASVVVKQARALVAEHGEDNDARLRLRNERRVLQVLDGVDGVPRFVDHFRYGTDEFLVTSHCGAATLADKVRAEGPFHAGEGAGLRALSLLAGRLAEVVSAVHARGVVMRDLSPKNVLIDDEQVTVIDFGLSGHAGLHLPGGTPGYGPARQFRDEPPEPGDDLHALAMTLLFAATGLHPVDAGDDPEVPRVRALQTIGSRYGSGMPTVISCIADLLSADDEVARGAFGRLRCGRRASRSGAARSLPAVPEVTRELAAEVAESLLRDLIGRARAILSAPANSLLANDISLYSGTAGIGLELLVHRERDSVAACLSELVGLTARVARRVVCAPGLFTGLGGVRVFLHEARLLGVESREVGFDDAGDILAGDVLAGDDLIEGAAGVGLGYLSLYLGSGEPAYLRGAARCVEQVIGAEARVSGARPGGKTPGPGVDPAIGRAHGLAGVAELLLSFAEVTADAAACSAAESMAAELATRTRWVLGPARLPSATRLSASWCQGLAGVGQTLLHASIVLDDPELTDLAAEAADVCLERVPRLEVLGQCCGATGIGNFVIDVAVRRSDERYWAGAHDVAAHLLLRSAGTMAHPDFAAGSHEEDIAGWATGLAGYLPFFRRLAHRGGPDCLPAPLGSQLRYCGSPPGAEGPNPLLGGARS